MWKSQHVQNNVLKCSEGETMAFPHLAWFTQPKSCIPKTSLDRRATARSSMAASTASGSTPWDNFCAPAAADASSDQTWQSMEIRP